MSYWRRLWRYSKGLPRWKSIGGAIVIVAVLVIIVHAATRAPADDTSANNISHVHIASVASLSSASGPLPVTGKVTSLNQATILSQSSGEIVSLNAKLGDHVAAGQVIASFDSSSQQAAITQAEGSYEAAQAALQKAQGSTALNASIGASQAATSANNAGAAAIAALQSAYAALDDAVHTKADPMFTNPRSVNPTLNLTTTDAQTPITVNNERPQLEAILVDASKRAADASLANIDSNAVAISADAQSVVIFLNDLVRATNSAIATPSVSATQIAVYQSTASAARSEVTAALTALASAKSAYDTASSGAQTASNSATNGSQNDIAAAEANVKQALGTLQSARANLEKTVIRSPISGTIVTLTITQGDFVSQFSQIAEVSNPGALEVQTSVTPDDAKTLVAGGKATIGGNIDGVITSVAPALDPTTGKIQVKVGITGKGTLTDGDTVSLTLSRATDTNPPADLSAEKAGLERAAIATSTNILIPIIAVKLIPTGAEVFTVSGAASSSTLIAHAITLGNIEGDEVTATSGLTPDMDIVTDARGLTEGQTVIVDH